MKFRFRSFNPDALGLVGTVAAVLFVATVLAWWPR